MESLRFYYHIWVFQETSNVPLSWSTSFQGISIMSLAMHCSKHMDMLLKEIP